MANWRSNFLKQLVGGDTMKDYQHAARLYLDDSFRLSPKNKFLYHVVFNINPAATGSAVSGTEKIELGMIVKRTDLPSYNFNVEPKNQYNYKNYVQTSITYLPVTITLHDDMGDVATAFWKSYYQHYIVDTNLGQTGYMMAGYDNVSPPLRYGLDTGNNSRFFNSISVFQLSRGLFTEYKMMNPIVNDWSNGSMDQADGQGLNEHTFSISYSGVLMRNGSVGGDPQGFATFHYDNTPSPNQTGGNGIFGALGGITNTASLLQSGNFLGAGLSAINTYQKIKSGKATRGAREEIIGIAKDAIKKGTNNLGATSKPGVSFPLNLKQQQTTNKQIEKNVRVNTSVGSISQGKIVLNPKQAEIYLNKNYNAKLKFTKNVSYRLDASIDINEVDTEWSTLTASKQNEYLINAGKVLSGLIKNNQYVYEVSPSEYTKFVEAPLQESATTVVNNNDAETDQLTSSGSITSSSGYSY